MTLREQFEARFPVPAGVAWSEEHQSYGWIKLTKSAFQRVITYRALWTGWQESRAALVVKLPTLRKADSFAQHDSFGPDDLAAAYKSAHLDCHSAIEAAGVKVAP